MSDKNINFDFNEITSDKCFCAAFQLMKILRLHLDTLENFSNQIKRQWEKDYTLLGLWIENDLVGLAGYRLTENLLYGRFLYVDDLVVKPDLQSKGYGAQLLEHVRNIAISKECDHFVLDTGLHMPLAQRFYFRNGLLAKGMHFVSRL